MNELTNEGREPPYPFVGTLKEFVNHEFNQLIMKKNEIERKYVG